MRAARRARPSLHRARGPMSFPSPPNGGTAGDSVRVRGKRARGARRATGPSAGSAGPPFQSTMDIRCSGAARARPGWRCSHGGKSACEPGYPRMPTRSPRGVTFSLCWQGEWPRSEQFLLRSGVFPLWGTGSQQSSETDHSDEVRSSALGRSAARPASSAPGTAGTVLEPAARPAEPTSDTASAGTRERRESTTPSGPHVRRPRRRRFRVVPHPPPRCRRAAVAQVRAGPGTSTAPRPAGTARRPVRSWSVGLGKLGLALQGLRMGVERQQVVTEAGPGHPVPHDPGRTEARDDTVRQRDGRRTVRHLLVLSGGALVTSPLHGDHLLCVRRRPGLARRPTTPARP
ncbi:hypothetical protein LX15_001389 [Streptoalloteichus tenebrarius]|uniref:Uncharacterized protein n=1 Tax=Streptoalloteichus tenebrarius (strain ATCC 17920 / DSM 40477 / JCM 4838 / CBS 697.72 / NBRC 16177 / NCIMB 11028 / NRRL B-12390 / A12253. 1 / ISP 5477) TaxID=1933 RepID=A0ABT1HQB5_STRSD|nr:hypothetical protein [Streptoalloteichus tenebrarius]